MNSDEGILLNILRKHHLLNTSLLNSKSIIIGLFNQSGCLDYANEGLKQILQQSGLADTPTDLLINPDWEKIISYSGNGSVFKGKLTLGNRLQGGYTFDSEIFRLDDQILLFGEVDFMELFHQNDQLSVLNQQVNNLQRQLVKEKKALEKAMSDLDDLNQEKNRYIGMVAHDLRNPIGVAQSFARLLLEECHENTFEENHKQLEIINKSCSFSLNLITDMLDLAKIEAGIIDLNMESIDYIDFCKRVVSMNQIFARHKNQEILFTSSLNKYETKMDGNKIEQVLNNLLGNAIKFSERETTIQVSVSLSEFYLETEVTDEGQGIPVEELNKIFKPFSPGTTKSTSGEKSYGLGLAIVKRIIDAHQGSVSVSSEQGKGSTFLFRLPLEL
jgi:signal transduction histidine kinase